MNPTVFHADDTATLWHADACHMPLGDESVDLVVTSPPYFALRSYTDGGEHYDGQIGSEPTPAEFLTALWTVMDECWRVLKPSGSCWVNLGDKYSGSGGNNNSNLGERATKRGPSAYIKAADTAAKSLMGLPWRFALGITSPDPYRTCYQPGDHPQWILRAEVVWSKPNGLPESVTDRVRRSHEQWFHLTKAPRYFSAVDEVRETQSGGVVVSGGSARNVGGGTSEQSGAFSKDGGFNDYRKANGVAYNPLGKLPGSVWTIPSEPLKVPEHLGVDHFAAYPQEWPRRIILGWSPSGICTACGEGRRPVVEKDRDEALLAQRVAARGPSARDCTQVGAPGAELSLSGADYAAGAITHTITGYSCDCPTPDAPTRPAVVLDPFCGTGTTVMVARALGRRGIGLDLSRDYLRLAKWRVWESGHAAKTLARTNADRQGSLL
jgi:hypothetical protein